MTERGSFDFADLRAARRLQASKYARVSAKRQGVRATAASDRISSAHLGPGFCDDKI